jgi:radical SAM superfamily enzyme YgiQ (UPF0313 family)
MNTHLSKNVNKEEVILVNPPVPPYWYKTECLGIGYLAGVLRENKIPVKIIDANVSNIGIKEILDNIKGSNSIPIVGFTVASFEAFNSALRLSYKLKYQYPEIHICLGGHFATFWYKEILESFYTAIDSIVISEGEETFLELVQYVISGRDWRHIKGVAYYDSEKVVLNSGRHLIAELDSLPFPARDTTKEIIKQGFPVAICSSRGCTFNCIFCQIHKFYKMNSGFLYRTRSAQNIVEEIDFLSRYFDAKTFFFVDDNFIIGEKGKERAYEIANEIIRRRLRINFIMQCLPSVVEKELFRALKKAGLFLVYLGFESPIERSLKFFRKPIKFKDTRRAINVLSSLNIEISPGVILYEIETSLDELKESIKIFKDNPKMMPFDIHGLIILKGTDLETYLEKKGRLIKQNFRLDFFTYDPRVELIRRILADYRKQTPYYNLLFLLYKNLLSLSNDADPIRKKVIKDTIANVSSLNLFFLETLIKDIEKGSFENLPSLFAKTSTQFDKIAIELKRYER